MAKANLLWGAERIRGELLKLGLRVGKRSAISARNLEFCVRELGTATPEHRSAGAKRIDDLHWTELLPGIEIFGVKPCSVTELAGDSVVHLHGPWFPAVQPVRAQR